MNELERKEKKRTLQTKVIVGKGEKQFFVEKDIVICPPSPPVFEIVSVDVKVDVFDTKVITGGDCEWGWAKVIFNAWIRKDIIYKTVEHVHDGTVNGPLFATTLKIPLGGFVDVEPLKGEKIKEGDIAEVIKAKFEGAKEELHDEIRIKKMNNEIRGCKMNEDMRCKLPGDMHGLTMLEEEERAEIKVFKKLLEKAVFEIEFKIVRIEHVTVKEEHHKKEDLLLEEEPDTLLPE